MKLTGRSAVFNWPAELQMDEDQSLPEYRTAPHPCRGLPQASSLSCEESGDGKLRGERGCLEGASRIEQ